MNAIYNIQSALDSSRNILEVAAQYTGKIGNALKRSGAVLESSYRWMNEDFSPTGAAKARWEKLQTGIEDTENALSAIGSVASEIVSIKDVTKEFAVARLETQVALQQASQGEFAIDQYGNPVAVGKVGDDDVVTLGETQIKKYQEPVDTRAGELQARLDSQPRESLDDATLGKP
jgi:nitrogen regulatory protein PII-like uncharacterized protein